MGAAVITDGDSVITGALVENVSLGLAMCAERVALFASVAAGERPTALVLVSPRTDSAVTFPCGACLQVGLELGGPDLLVVAATVEGPVEQHRLADLLPGDRTSHDRGAGPDRGRALGVGSTYDQVASFLGREIVTTFEVVEYDPPHTIRIVSTASTFPLDPRVLTSGESGDQGEDMDGGVAHGLVRPRQRDPFAREPRRHHVVVVRRRRIPRLAAGQ